MRKLGIGCPSSKFQISGQSSLLFSQPAALTQHRVFPILSGIHFPSKYRLSNVHTWIAHIIQYAIVVFNHLARHRSIPSNDESNMSAQFASLHFLAVPLPLSLGRLSFQCFVPLGRSAKRNMQFVRISAEMIVCMNCNPTSACTSPIAVTCTLHTHTTAAVRRRWNNRKSITSSSLHVSAFASFPSAHLFLFC